MSTLLSTKFEYNDGGYSLLIVKWQVKKNSANSALFLKHFLPKQKIFI